MALTEKTIMNSIAWRPEYCTIEVQKANLILRDGVEVSRDYHRHVVEPGADVADEDADVQKIAELFTTERAAKAAELAAAEEAPPLMN